ncbi:aspartic peptidase A1 [Mycena rebaudengoi]|nr:aspartic peptidase A1 [Mycena rebaudengoi]
MLLSLSFVFSIFLGASNLQYALCSAPIIVPLYSAPQNDGSLAARTDSGLTGVTVSTDRQSYFAVLQTGAINFRVALDTASSDLWIMASSCTTAACSHVPRYPLAYHSPTFVEVDQNKTLFKAAYADGTEASGFVARESVTLANLTVADQAFGLVTNTDLKMLDDVSGILGLGFSRLSGISAVANSTSFFATLAQQGILDYPLFGLSLTNNASGTLSLGAIDTTIVANVSKIGWNKVVEFAPIGSESNTASYLHWATPLSAFAVNGKQISPQPTYAKNTGNSSLALFDIGASGIYGPYQDVQRLFAQIDEARLVDPTGQWAIPCDTAVTLSFTFGEQSYTLQPIDYIIGPASGNPKICLTWPRAHLPSADGLDWQFGAPFLRTVYSIFSFGINLKEPPLIGFYALNNNTASTPGSAAAFLSDTVATTLPNSLLQIPSFTTPAYAFNSSVKAPTGGIVSSALATSTYSAIFGKTLLAATSLPGITPEPRITMIVVTNAQGVVSTLTSTFSPTFTLGVPPGWTGSGSVLRAPFLFSTIRCLVLPLTLLLTLDFIFIL